MIWWTRSWNPIIGCTPCSPACANCYAEALHTQRHKAYLAGKRMPDCYAEPFNRVRFLPERLSDPLHWRKPQRVFLCNMSDLFHKDVQDAWRDQAFAVMALCPQHEFLVLTKRWASMPEYYSGLGNAAEVKARFAPATVLPRRVARGIDALGWPLSNVLHGATVWDQASMDEAAKHLLKMPIGARLFLSVEPMLGPVIIPAELLARISWVVTGGETGPGARPMHPDWPRKLRDDCVAAGVPFMFKQWGEFKASGTESVVMSFGSGAPFVAWPDGTIAHGEDVDHGGMGVTLHRLGSRRAGRKLDGQTWEEVPAC